MTLIQGNHCEGCLEKVSLGPENVELQRSFREGSYENVKDWDDE